MRWEEYAQTFDYPNARPDLKRDIEEQFKEENPKDYKRVFGQNGERKTSFIKELAKNIEKTDKASGLKEEKKDPWEGVANWAETAPLGKVLLKLSGLEENPTNPPGMNQTDPRYKLQGLQPAINPITDIPFGGPVAGKTASLIEKGITKGPALVKTLLSELGANALFTAPQSVSDLATGTANLKETGQNVGINALLGGIIGTPARLLPKLFKSLKLKSDLAGFETPRLEEPMSAPLQDPAVIPQKKFMDTQAEVLTHLRDTGKLSEQEIIGLATDKIRDGANIRDIVQDGIKKNMSVNEIGVRVQKLVKTVKEEIADQNKISANIPTEKATTPRGQFSRVGMNPNVKALPEPKGQIIQLGRKTAWGTDGGEVKLPPRSIEKFNDSISSRQQKKDINMTRSVNQMKTMAKENPALPGQKAMTERLMENLSPAGRLLQTLKQTGKISEKAANTPEIRQLKTKRVMSEIEMKAQKNMEDIVEKNRKVLSHKETIEYAEKNPDILMEKIKTKEETKAINAATYNTKKLIRALDYKAENGILNAGEMRRKWDAIEAEAMHGTDIARELEFRKVVAEKLPESPSAMLRSFVLKKMIDSGKKIQELRALAEKFELDGKLDWNNLESITSFYRTYVKPTFGDWLTALRYNSMLSSIKTQEVNLINNFLNTGVIYPIAMTMRGALDWIGTGFGKLKPRSFYAGEGWKYFKAYWSGKNFKEAFKNVADVLGNRKLPESFEQIMLMMTKKGDKGRTVENILTVPVKLMYAMDSLSTTLSKNAHIESLKFRGLKSGKEIENISEEALKESRKALLTQDFGEKGIGWMSETLDKVGSMVMKGRQSKNATIRTVSNFMFPFVKYPLNALKEGLAYTPFGLINLIGNTNKAMAVSKILMGGTVIGLGSMLAVNDRISWRAPANRNERERLVAAGWKPYSIKIGNKWISFASLPPALQFPLAVVAAVHDSVRNKKLSESQAEAVMTGMAKSWTWSMDQSMVKNFGDLANAVNGDTLSLYQTISSLPKQLIPFRALISQIEKLIDPNERKIDKDGSNLTKIIDGIARDIPGWASSRLEAVKDSEGKEYTKTWGERAASTLLPTQMGIEVPKEMAKYKRDKEVKRMNDYTGQLLDLIRKGKSDSDIKERINEAISVNPMEYVDLKRYRDSVMSKMPRIHEILKSQRTDDEQDDNIRALINQSKNIVTVEPRKQIRREEIDRKKKARLEAMKNYARRQ